MRANPTDIAAAIDRGLIPAANVPAALPFAVKTRKRSKYGNQKVELDGKTFDSKREAERYAELKILVAAGTITRLRCQVPIRCVVNGIVVCEYRADFCYLRDGQEVAEDSKGCRTPVYKLKKKLVKACTGIEIQEV